MVSGTVLVPRPGTTYDAAPAALALYGTTASFETSHGAAPAGAGGLASNATVADSVSNVMSCGDGVPTTTGTLSGLPGAIPATVGPLTVKNCGAFPAFSALPASW